MNKLHNIPIFFIVGRPRTGTTLLLKLFDAHPNVIIPWECQYIINLYPKYGKIKQWTKDDLLAFYDDVSKTWQFKFWPVDHDKLKSDLLSREGDISYAELCKLVHTSYQSLYPKKELLMIGDKNPGYTIYIDRLKKIYPDAKFIFINRDYRDNFYSIRNVDFELPVVSIVVYKWKFFYKKALKASAKYPDSIFFLNYEDLAENPPEKFREICDFIGLKYDPSVFDFHEKKDATLELLKTERSRWHHKSLMDPVSTKRIGLWKDNLSDKEIRIADFVAGKYAEKTGYKRIHSKVGFKTWLRALPGIFYARSIYCLTYIIDKLPYKTRAVILNKGPLTLVRIFLRLKRSKE